MSPSSTPPIEHIYTRPGSGGPFPIYTPFKGSYDPALKISPQGSKPVLRITPELVVKFGSKVRVNEAEGLLLVERHAPEVPAPRTKASLVVFIVMSLVEGEELEQAWDSLTIADKSAIGTQMAGYMQAIRAIPAPISPAICSVLKDPVQDAMFWYQATKGPFDTIQDFNAALVAFQHKASPREHLRLMIEGALAQIPHSRSVFTHADLQARNIMVSKGKVTGIIDWEMCGWYPEYWEYARCFRVGHFAEDWPDLIRQMLEPHDIEYVLLRLINTHVWWSG